MALGARKDSRPLLVSLRNLSGPGERKFGGFRRVGGRTQRISEQFWNISRPGEVTFGEFRGLVEEIGRISSQEAARNNLGSEIISAIWVHQFSSPSRQIGF